MSQQSEEIIGKAYDARLMRRLLAYARPYATGFALAFVLLMAVAGIELVRPYVIKLAIDDHLSGPPQWGVAMAPERVPDAVPARVQVTWNEQVLVAAHYQPDRFDTDQPGIDVIHVADHPDAQEAFRRQNAAQVGRLAMLLVAASAVAFGLNYGQNILLHHLGQNIVLTIRGDLFSHLQRMDLAFFDRNPVGRLVTRLTTDTENLSHMYSHVLVSLFKDVLMLVGIVVVMFRLNAELALVSMTTLPLIAVATVMFRTKARAAYRRVRTALARINAELNENITGMRIVQVFNREQHKYTEFEATNKEYYRAGVGEMMVYAVFRPLTEFVGTLALALLVWYGGLRVLGGRMPFGLVYAFINYVDMFFGPINALTEKYNTLQAAMASSERIFQLLDTPAKVEDAPDAVSLEKVEGRIEFKNVWFAYNGEDWVLRDVSFTIEPGETVAFVGATGAGKTSIISLINRFYDVQRGEILLDGVNVKRLRLEDLRRSIATVLQDVFLFTGDIRDNIRLGNEEISDERIAEVARLVNADYFIRRLPNGYDEPVTERGSTLSAGQRQLLAFARALAFDPAILVLDEATSNIDTETEMLIQDALPRLIAGRTTIVVAHRLSTVQHADKIIVLHKGKIREIGSHQELLAKRGFYYDLYRLQYEKKEAGVASGASGPRITSLG